MIYSFSTIFVRRVLNNVALVDDILRARVHTVCPEEHFIRVEGGGHENLRSLIVYDSGGSASLLAGALQFFNDIRVIIFLAPLSAFNETLAENPAVNRLADSMQLWRTVCSNQLLTTVEFILFLNKVDIFTRKIQSGIRFADYVSSYRDRPNEPKDIINCASFGPVNASASRLSAEIALNLSCQISPPSSP
ncbi:hypothetical protein MSAN_00331900 [Mycena sanguinolenta]|uniref:Uncharacterized protein n=1 Tax=Mycena sanguinolenta TaxID=230812 RepID=A0A8H6ZCP7_9AGAR|nr:hypothetical protein MSAN_00331900 [Mycena sanguinolenta]